MAQGFTTKSNNFIIFAPAMRQIIAFFLMMSVLCVRAQVDEQLSMVHVDGGRQWRSEHVSFTRWDDWTHDLCLFVPEHDRHIRHMVVGLYTPDDVLIWQTKKWLVVSDAGTIIRLDTKAKGKWKDVGGEFSFSFDSLMDHVKNGWYVRITTDGLDVKVVAIKNTQ